MSDHVERMPWFIQNFIQNSRWSGFREMQVRVFDRFFDHNDHILISSGTSSGKTEAAIFPILTSLYDDPIGSGFGALYIGPLKALIDDQFERIEPIIRETEIPVAEWHGDVGHSKKINSLKNARGILQITPESLQNLIVDHDDILTDIFGNLRFIVIDEVHAFSGSRRGLQLLCCLETIERRCGCRPRRIGLSATISDVQGTCEWISASTGIETFPIVDNNRKDAEISIRYNHIPSADMRDGGKDRKIALTGFYRQLFADTDRKNCIIFTNSRSTAENVASSLMRMKDALDGVNDVYVHHGSLSKEYRKLAEDALKDTSRTVTVVSTSTLELGVDVGSLDLIVQLEPPHSCSSLMQRMGRSGRRDSPQRLILYCNEDDDKRWNMLGYVPMNLIKAIAMCNLISEGWVEPSPPDRYPYGLLYHQTMEYMKRRTGVRFTELKEYVLSMFPFRSIDESEYKMLLRHMVSTGRIQRMEDGTLLITPESEREIFGRDFCSVFTSEKEIEVKTQGKVIGSIQNIPEIGACIQLAGHVWEIMSFDPNTDTAEVKESDGNVMSSWKSSPIDTDRMVMKEIRKVLSGSETYDFLDERGNDRLNDARESASGMLMPFSETDKGWRMYPWTGTREFDTIRRFLEDSFEVDRVWCFQPYLLDVITDSSPEQVMSSIRRIKRTNDLSRLITDSDDITVGKYDEEVPRDLQEKCFIDARFEIDADLI